MQRSQHENCNSVRDWYSSCQNTGNAAEWPWNQTQVCREQQPVLNHPSSTGVKSTRNYSIQNLFEEPRGHNINGSQLQGSSKCFHWERKNVNRRYWWQQQNPLHINSQNFGLTWGRKLEFRNLLGPLFKNATFTVHAARLISNLIRR